MAFIAVFMEIQRGTDSLLTPGSQDDLWDAPEGRRMTCK